MFTGIIEEIAEVIAIEKNKSNVIFTLKANLANLLKVDQSLAHNGCCLTVIEQNEVNYKVTAIQETLERTNLSNWSIGTRVNLERCMKADGRFDGHIVQGHVDCVATCTEILDLDGSWKYTFRYNAEHETVEKGSITINGTSLTVVDSLEGAFSVCIIPYTYEHTNFNEFCVGTLVNIEFDVFGKYIQKYLTKID
tara:strand:- start:25899 stop:26483 length:585 start_codon:yes stop_codon:yes gene_type:complete